MPLILDTKQHLAYVAEHPEITQWNPGEISGICRAALAEIERLEELLRPVRLLEAVESMAENNRRIADAADRISGHLEWIGFK